MADEADFEECGSETEIVYSAPVDAKCGFFSMFSERFWCCLVRSVLSSAVEQILCAHRRGAALV